MVRSEQAWTKEVGADEVKHVNTLMNVTPINIDVFLIKNRGFLLIWLFVNDIDAFVRQVLILAIKIGHQI